MHTCEARTNVNGVLITTTQQESPECSVLAHHQHFFGKLVLFHATSAWYCISPACPGIYICNYVEPPPRVSWQAQLKKKSLEKFPLRIVSTGFPSGKFWRTFCAPPFIAIFRSSNFLFFFWFLLSHNLYFALCHLY